MNNTKFKEDAATAWTWVGSWILFIYTTIPLARTLQEFIRDRGGKAIFLWVTYIAFSAGALAVFRSVRQKKVSLSPGRGLLLALILGLFSYLAWTLRANPEEALHFVQYGVLSLLLYRALRHHIADVSIYFAGAMIGATFGILDECIQWIVPRRYFDFRDIGINILAVVLIQLALGLGIKPASIQGRAGVFGKKLGLSILALNLGIILMCFSNTPQFIDFVHEKTEGAEWLKQPMAEYGYLYVDDEIGRFKSRLSPEELKKQDKERYAELVALLHKVMHEHRYHRFIRLVPAHTKPLLVESRVHLFRRDRYASRVDEPRHEAKKTKFATVAWYENRIMEKYFPHLLANSKYFWSPATRAKFDQLSEKHGEYYSAVSRQLITVISQKTLTLILSGLIFVTLFCFWRAGRKGREA